MLDEVTDIDGDLLQLLALKDSTTASVTAEVHTSLSQQVDNLQNHKRALENSIRENLAELRQNSNQKVQQVQEEVSCVQAALRDLAENVGTLWGGQDVPPDIRQLKELWRSIQV